MIYRFFPPLHRSLGLIVPPAPTDVFSLGSLWSSPLPSLGTPIGLSRRSVSGTSPSYRLCNFLRLISTPVRRILRSGLSLPPRLGDVGLHPVTFVDPKVRTTTSPRPPETRPFTVTHGTQSYPRKSTKHLRSTSLRSHPRPLGFSDKIDSTLYCRRTGTPISTTLNQSKVHRRSSSCPKRLPNVQPILSFSSRIRLRFKRLDSFVLLRRHLLYPSDALFS